jgi:hypothetical protein
MNWFDISPEALVFRATPLSLGRQEFRSGTILEMSDFG